MKARRRRHSVKADGQHPVDTHVGHRLRLRRTLLGMSQEQLAQKLDLTFQQVQKYERGFNRVSASRLFEIGHALDIPVSFFFDDMPGHRAPVADNADDVMLRRESLELMRAYYQITPDLRQALLALVKQMGARS